MPVDMFKILVRDSATHIFYGIELTRENPGDNVQHTGVHVVVARVVLKLADALG
jgi:hypothetical protein